MANRASITFYGGAGMVTGANFLLDTGDKRILIDCGALQSEHRCEIENSKPFAYEPASIDVLLVTHAHADHIGRIPQLVRDGFRSVIYSTPATKDLAALMFDDAINVMRADSKRHSCTPMYEQQDVEHALGLWQTHEYHESFKIADASIELLDAGHILGSAMVKFSRSSFAHPSHKASDGHSNASQGKNERTIIFTGDLGNSPEPLLHDTESPVDANYLVMESVYGDRVHEGIEGRREVLRCAIEDARNKGGVLLIPSFSIERTQILLFEIDSMMEKGELAPIPVYLDAPLAIRVTDVFRKYPNLLNENVHEHFAHGDDPFTFKTLHVIRDVAESRQIHDAPDPKVIIAGAGMSSGGRIRAHEKKYLGEKSSTVLFVGYQAPESLGRRIEEGEKNIEIDGARVHVQAQIKTLTGYSGHKDRDGLLAFVKSAKTSLEKVFVVMGEPQSEHSLAEHIRDTLHLDAFVPEAGERIEIDW